MTGLPCGIIHFTLIPVSHLKLCLNKRRDWGFQRRFPLVFMCRQTWREDTGSARMCTGCWGINPSVSQVHLLIGSFGFLLYISRELEGKPGKLANDPGSGEISTVWAPKFFSVPLVTTWYKSATLQAGWDVCAAQQSRMGRFKRQNILFFIMKELQENKRQCWCLHFTAGETKAWKDGCTQGHRERSVSWSAK